MPRSLKSRVIGIRPRVRDAALAVFAVIVVFAAFSTVQAAGVQTDSTEASPVLDLSTPTEARSILFFGDSYTAGPSQLPNRGYACLTATTLGYQCNLETDANMAYVPGKYMIAATTLEPQSAPIDIPTVDSRIDRARVLYGAEQVVIDAGRNDLARSADDFSASFLETVRHARTTFPASRLSIIVPWTLDDLSPSIVIDGTAVRVATVMQDALTSDESLATVTLIDPGALGWLASRDIESLRSAENKFVPNEAGDAIVAGDLVAAMTAQIPTSVADESDN